MTKWDTDDLRLSLWGGGHPCHPYTFHYLQCPQRRSRALDKTLPNQAQRDLAQYSKARIICGVPLPSLWCIFRLVGEQIRVFWKTVLASAFVLPFAIPGYIMAYAYASFFAPGGPAQSLWGKFFDFPMPSLYSFWGVSLVLSLVNYPYVYLWQGQVFLAVVKPITM